MFFRIDSRLFYPLTILIGRRAGCICVKSSPPRQTRAGFNVIGDNINAVFRLPDQSMIGMRSG